MRYDLVHRTAYAYASDVSISHHLARLEPRPGDGQQLLAHTLAIDPAPEVRARRLDYYGNPTVFFTLRGSHRALQVVARSRVEVAARAVPAPRETPAWETVRAACRGTAAEALAAREMTFPSDLVPLSPGVRDYAAASFAPGRPLLDAALDLTARIHADFAFDPKATTVATPLEQVFRNRRGVCQDFAHLELAGLRSLGLPARYVSGYLETDPLPGQPRLTGADASHAWLHLFVPGAGWIGLDPTTNLLVQDRHITVAWGRDFNDVSPLRGVIVGGGRHTLEVGVDVVRVPADAPPA